MNRRRVLATAGAFIGSLTGCIGLDSEEPTGSRTPTPTKAPTSTPTERPPDAGGDYGSTGTPSKRSDLAEKTNNPNPDHPIRIINNDETTQNVTVNVTQHGTVVDTFSREVNASANVVAYNIRQTDPEGIEEYNITATVGNETDTATVRTNDCFGDITIDIRSDSSLAVSFAIC